MNKDSLSILVLSCDAYCDLWDDFFSLRDKFWPDCDSEWFLVTENADYRHNGVEVIKCGKSLNWAGRLRYALNYVKSEYIGLFLEDYYICSTVNNERINYYINLMRENDVKCMNLTDHNNDRIKDPSSKKFCDHLYTVPKHRKYGLNTSAAVWNKCYLLERLGDGDYSAWEFEKKLCDEAASPEGYKGLLLVDDLASFNVCPEPVVIQGLFYKPAIKYYKNIGYNIDTSHRGIMSFRQQFLYDTKIRIAHFPYFRNLLKWIGTNLFGIKFFTE